MKTNENNIKRYLNDILNIASPSGYSKEVINYVKNEFDRLKVSYYITNKGCICAKLKGKDDENQITFSAHLDTLGAMVKEIKSNGTLGITIIGGYMMTSIEGENCVIIKNDGKRISGTIQTIKPSVHISGQEARELKREPENMEVIIDEIVNSKEDVQKLGIEIGDFIAIDTRTTFTESGFVKSRYLDDKASAAILLEVINDIVSSNTEIPYTTNFFFSVYEEVGHGAKGALPEKTKEFIAVDMGAPGLNQNSSEYGVCICAKDSGGPYDYDLKLKLIEICKENNIDYKIDTYPYYGSDATAALNAGYDFKTGLIGPGVFASHGYERTHMMSLTSTFNLIYKYITLK